MYRYLDQTAASLGIGARFHLWAMRNWMAAYRARNCPSDALSAGFARWNAVAGLEPFAMAMATLTFEAREEICFHPPGHPRIGEHEALLLALFDRVGECGRAEFREMLGLIVPETSTAALQIALEACAAAFDAAGLCPSTASGRAAPKENSRDERS